MIERVGYYSLVRFSSDVARGEGRNVAVILVGDSPEDGAVRAAPLSRVSTRARHAGVLDALLRSIAARVQTGQIVGRAGLARLVSTIPSTVSITEPRPAVVVGDATVAMEQLYRSFVGVRSSREPFRKGEILDRLVATLVRTGAPVERDSYLQDFAIDALIPSPQPAAIQVLSFCVGESRGVTVEREAGHFLFGLERLKVDAHAVVQPPTEPPDSRLWTSYDRVHRWLDDAGVPSIRPSEIQALADRYGGVEQLPLSYAG